MALYVDSEFLHDIMNVAQTAPGVLLNLVSDPLSEEAVEKFTQDWQKMKKL